MTNEFDGLDDAAAEVMHSQTSQIRNNTPSTQNQNPANSLDDAAADVLHSQASQIRNNVLSTQNQNPDQAAQYQHLAKFVGIPVESVYSDPDAVKAQASMQQLDTDKLTTQYPHLAQFMGDQQNVAKSHDDIHVLGALEAAVKGLHSAGMDGLVSSNLSPESANPSNWSSTFNPDPNAYQPPMLDNLKGAAFLPQDLSGNIADPNAKTPFAFDKNWTDLTKAPGFLAKGAASTANDVLHFGARLGLLAPSAWDHISDFMTGGNGTNLTSKYYQEFMQPLEDAQRVIYQPNAEASSTEKLMTGVGSAGGQIAAAALTAGESLLPETASFSKYLYSSMSNAARTMLVPAAASAAKTGKEVYDQTGDILQAQKAALASYLTTTTSAMAPVSMEGGMLKRVVSGFPLGVATGEMNRQLMNDAMPDSMQQPATAEDALISGLTGSMFAAGFGGSPVKDFMGQQAAKQANAQLAAATIEKMQAASQIAAQSKLRDRDPVAFRGFLQTMSDDAAEPHELYVNANTFADTLKQAGVTPAMLEKKLPDVAAQMKEGVETNGDIHIPTPDYLTSIAGSSWESSLLPHMKVDPEGMTYHEVQGYLQKTSDDLTSEASDIASKQIEQDQREQQLNAIQDDIKSQLESTGRFPSHVNDAYSALHRAWYDTNSQNMGLTPDEMYQQHPLNITADNNSGFSQESRGSFDPENNTIGLHKDADLSTFLHESGHFYLSAMHDMVSREGAPERMKGDFDTLLKHFGVEGSTPEERLSNWSAKDIDGQRAGHEQFAEEFEKNLLDGKAPTPELQGLFSRFRSWFLNVYRNLSGRMGQELDPEVKGVMDRMLASEDAIKEAERVRGYVEMHLDGEQSPEYEQYKSEADQATQDAIDKMTGDSIKEMKWLSNAKSKAMRDIQNAAKEKRGAIRDAVAKEVAEQPIEQAKTMLKEQNVSLAKTNYADLRLDVVAERFGFESGQSLAEQLKAGPTFNQKVSMLTEQRMLEKHGELIDPVSIQRAAEVAIHNEARSRMMAVGLKVLTKSPVSAREINRAAKEAADTAIAAKKISELRPKQYLASEAKANKELLKLAPKDPAGAAKAQREALLSNHLFRVSTDAHNEITGGLRYLKKYNKTATLQKLDPDIREKITDILDRFDLRDSPKETVTQQRSKQSLLEWRNAQIDAGLNPEIGDYLLNEINKTEYRDMSVEQFRGLVDTVKSMEKIGKERNEITVAGKKYELDQIVKNEFVPKLKERGIKYTPEQLIESPEHRNIGFVQKGVEKTQSIASSANADWLRPYFKANMYDMHEIAGPFNKYFFDPIFEANANKLRMSKDTAYDIEAFANEMGRDWQKSLDEFVPNDLLIDKHITEKHIKNGADPTTRVNMSFTRERMIMLCAHMGNDSGRDRVLSGYGWKPEDVLAFLNKNMTAEDIKAANKIWEISSKYWPDQEAQYRRLGLVTPEKIEARPFELKAGHLDGGYIHIKYDKERSSVGEKEQNKASKELTDNGTLQGYFRRTSITNGAMIERVDRYSGAIDFSLHTVEDALKQTIHDLAYRETLIAANKILEHHDVANGIKTAYGKEHLDALHTMLGRIANSNETDPTTNEVLKLMGYLRTGSVITAIGFRATTVAKHGSAALLKSMGYMGGSSRKYFIQRLALMFSDHQNQVQTAADKFGEIFARIQQQDRDYRQIVSTLKDPESLQAKAHRFGHSAVALCDLMSAVPTAWASYDRAITTGIPVREGGTGKPMNDQEATAYANRMVREAHGSNMESGLSNILTNKNEAVKTMTMLYGFMNNTYGQNVDMIDKLRTGKFGKPELFARAFATILVPGIATELINNGGPDDDKLGTKLGFIAKSVAGEEVGSVPYIRDALALMDGYHGKGTPSESWMQNVGEISHDAYRAYKGDPVNGKPIQTLADTLGVTLHLPLGQAGKTAQYGYDVYQHKIPAPQSIGEGVHDALLGHKKH